MSTRIGSFRSPEARERYLTAYHAAMREYPSPDAELDIETRYGVTRVYRHGLGDAPPIALLPGLSATSACWAATIPALAAHHPVYAIDTMGEAGRSVQTAPFADAVDRARWLDEVLAALGLTGVHLLGGSSGGCYAFYQAIHAPQRLASVSMLDPTTVTAGWDKAMLWHAAPAAILNRDWLWRRFLRWSSGQDVLDRPDVRLVLAGIREFRAKPPTQVCPSDELIRSVTRPVLALFAGRSVVHDAASAAAKARELLPHAEVELWPDATHAMTLDPGGNTRITERVLGFVKSVSETVL